MNAPLRPPRCLTRWMGGSVRLVDAIVAQIPEEHLDEHGHLQGLRLVDPFVGGGALFFRLQPQRAILADACAPLITAWRVVRDDVDGLVSALGLREADRDWQSEDGQAAEWFLSTREELNELLVTRSGMAAEPLRAAVLFFVLMRSGYSGLWRVDQGGQYNVAFDPGTAGKDLVREAHLRACSALLQRELSGSLYLLPQDFRQTLANKGAGDLIFADSPFVGLPKEQAQADLFGPPSKPTYAGWTATRWTEKDTSDLWHLLTKARDRGAFVIHENHDHPKVRAWADRVGFEVVPVKVHRSVSCDAETRGKAREVLVVGRPA